MLHRSIRPLSCGALLLASPAFARGQSVENLFPSCVTQTGVRPDDVASADFDGDGRLDVATIGGGQVIVTRQIGVLRFAAPVVQAQVNAKRILAADVSGDGIVDLVTAYDTLQVLLGNGAGGFAAQTALGTFPSSFSIANDVAVADLDLDGRVDLVATDCGNRKLRLFFGTGGGNFAAAVVISLQPGSHSPNDVVVARFDADPWPDIATCDAFYASRAVLLGLGGGAFAAPVFLPLANSSELVAGDFDGDGLMDMASTNLGNPSQLRIEKGDGAGGFAQIASIPLPGSGNTYLPTDLRAQDLDRDGDLDLVRFGTEGSLQVVRTLGGGAFAYVAKPVGGTSAASGFEFADIDSDGIADAVYPTLSGFAVYTSDGLGSFEARTPLDLAGQPDGSGLQRCDANNDGRDDVAFLTTTASLGVCLGTGAAGLAPAVYTVAAAWPYSEFVIVKLDADAFPDLVTRDGSGAMKSMLGAGDGTFHSPVAFGSVGTFVIGTGDYNGDGKADVFAPKPSPPPPQLPGSTALELYPGTGNGTFGPKQTVTPALWDLTRVFVRDVDGNGLADLLYTAGSGFGVLHQTSPLVFAQGWLQVMGADIERAELGFFDANALEDAALSLSDGRLAVLLGANGGIFAPPSYVLLGSTINWARGIEFADFDRDGHTDIAASCSDGTLRLIRGDGTGALLPQVVFSTMTSYSARVVALDADGDLDLDLVTGAPMPAVRENLGLHERPLAYCSAKTNSLGCVPSIGSSGIASAAATSGFVVRAGNVRNLKPGLLLYSVSGRTALAFSGGQLCLRGPIRRSTALSSGGSSSGSDCSGSFSIDMSAFAAGALGGNPLASLRIAGTVVNGQFWGRDPGFPAPDATTLSDALEYLIEP